MATRPDNLPDLVSAMLEPGFYPHSPAIVELRETHISWVLIAGDLVYKVKKPLTLPFLDYGSLERRRAFCHEELQLNDRFAPGVYLRIVGIAGEGDRFSLVDEDDPAASEYAVEMRRIDESRTLAALAERRELEPGQVEAVGRRVAELHAAAPVEAGADSVDKLLALVAENHETLSSCGEALLGAERLRSAEAFSRSFESARRPELERRAAAGRVRDCHGDLRAEHVVLGDEGAITIFDCIEFDPGLREIDVGADLAFLVMELMALASDELALRIVGAYREAGGDPGDDALLAFFACYRAWVRTKVACLRSLELAEAGAERASAEREALERFELGHRLAWQARRPLVLVICGVSGTGKSTLAGALAAIGGWRQLSSDLTRKELAGIAPSQRAGSEAYTAELTRRTYAKLGQLAREERERSAGVIVDATFNRLAARQAFRSELGEEAPVLFIECVAAGEILSERLRLRALDPDRVSDADLRVLRRQLEEREPLDEVPPRSRAELVAEAPPAQLAASAEALIDERIFAAQ